MYIGLDSSSVEFDNYIVQEGEKRTKWVKKKADKNCLSKNPDECLVWCLEESIYDEISVLYLGDTASTIDFELQEVSTPKRIEGGELE